MTNTVTQENIQRPAIRRVASIALCSATLLLSACGGSSSTESTSSAEEPFSNLISSTDAPIATSGTVVVEERGGRTIYDGWFSSAPSSETDPLSTSGLVAGVAGDDSCYVDGDSSMPLAMTEQYIGQRSVAELASKPYMLVQLNSGGQSSMRVFETPPRFAQRNPRIQLRDSMPNLAAANSLDSVGSKINISSRAGEFDTLSENTLGDTTVYAQEDRWQSDALPDDSVLTFEDSAIFSQLEMIQLPPLLPLIWQSPQNRIMVSAGTPLQWEPSFDEDVSIKLRLSATDFSDMDNPRIVTVGCNAVDDGSFTLPAEFQKRMPVGGSGIAVYAVRERVQNVVGDDASLTVVQLSYPEPL